MKELSVIEKEGEILIDISDIEKDRAVFLAECDKAVVVTDAETQAYAGKMVGEIKMRVGLIESRFEKSIERVKDMKRRIDEQRAFLVDAESEAVQPYKEIRAKIDAASLRYFNEQERIRREEIARKEAEERKRIEDERIAAAEKLESEGRPQAASAILDAPIEPKLPKIDTPPKTQLFGQSVVTTWDYKATAESLDIRFTTRDDKGFIVPDHKAIKAKVLSDRENTKIQGVEVFPVQSVRQR